MANKGLGLASHLVATRFGLATASRFRLLPEHRSGVLAPTQAKLLACSSPTKKYLIIGQVFFGRASGARTHGLLHPMQARYHCAIARELSRLKWPVTLLRGPENSSPYGYIRLRIFFPAPRTRQF